MTGFSSNDERCGHTHLFADDFRGPERVLPCLYCKIEQLEQEVAKYKAWAASSDMSPGLAKVYDAFQIGSAVRTPDVLLANVQNAKRRSDCLSAVEREFFTYVVTDEDGEDIERCDLSWGADPAEYVNQFREANKSALVVTQEKASA